MADKDKEKEIIVYLINNYPALKEFLIDNDNRFNLKKKKLILKIIDTDEDKEKYYEWENLRDSVLQSTTKVVLYRFSASVRLGR